MSTCSLQRGTMLSCVTYRSARERDGCIWEWSSRMALQCRALCQDLRFKGGKRQGKDGGTSVARRLRQRQGKDMNERTAT